MAREAVAALALRRPSGSLCSTGFDPFGGSTNECQCFQTAVIHSACVYSDTIVTTRVRS